MYVRIFLVLILFSFSSCYSQENMALIKNWHSYPIQTKDDSIIKYNYSPKEWTVSLKSDEVLVAEKKENKTIGDLPFKVQVNKEDKINAVGDVCYLKVDDGFLVAFNRGEWGGSLYWVATNVKNNTKYLMTKWCSLFKEIATITPYRAFIIWGVRRVVS